VNPGVQAVRFVMQPGHILRQKRRSSFPRKRIFGKQFPRVIPCRVICGRSELSAFRATRLFFTGTFRTAQPASQSPPPEVQCCVCVKLHLRHKQTNEQTNKQTGRHQESKLVHF